MKRWLNNVGILAMADLREFYRTRFIILSSSVMPVFMTLAFSSAHIQIGAETGTGSYFEFIYPAILALGCMFSATFSGGYMVILDRQKSVIREMALSPTPYSAYAAARMFATVIKCFPQLGLTLLVAAPFYSGWASTNWAWILAAYVLTSLLFAACGMILGAYSNILTLPGWSNLVLMPSMYFCAVFFPLSDYQNAAIAVQLMPFTGAVELFRYGITGIAPLYGIGMNLLLLVGYTILLALLWIVVLQRRIREG